MQIHHFLIYITFTMATTSTEQDLQFHIQHNASTDGIDLSVLSFTKEAIASIAALSTHLISRTTYDFTHATRIDTHTQYAPPFSSRSSLKRNCFTNVVTVVPYHPGSANSS
jgi:hypothetical protein